MRNGNSPTRPAPGHDRTSGRTLAPGDVLPPPVTTIGIALRRHWTLRPAPDDPREWSHERVAWAVAAHAAGDTSAWVTIGHREHHRRETEWSHIRRKMIEHGRLADDTGRKTRVMPPVYADNAEQAFAHIEALLAAGLAPTRIAALAGLGRSTMKDVAKYVRRGETRKLFKSTADAVLAVPLPGDPAAELAAS